jgi:hypothetical protein
MQNLANAYEICNTNLVRLVYLGRKLNLGLQRAIECLILSWYNHVVQFSPSLFLGFSSNGHVGMIQSSTICAFITRSTFGRKVDFCNATTRYFCVFLLSRFDV